MTVLRLTALYPVLLCFSWSSGLPSLQLVKLWPTCIFACRPLLLELSLQRAELSFHHLIQTCLKNIPVPLEYAYSALETILLFDDGLYTLCSKKSDAKIQITIITALLIRINYPLSSFNYHLSGTNVANFNKIHRTISEQQILKKLNLKKEFSNMENTD